MAIPIRETLSRPGWAEIARRSGVLDGNGIAVPLAVRPTGATALAHDPAQRYAGAAVFLRSLQALTGDAVRTALPKAVAVIDVGNGSNAPELSWIGSALGDGLHAELARVDGLALVRRDTVLREVASASSSAAVDPD